MRVSPTRDSSSCHAGDSREAAMLLWWKASVARVPASCCPLGTCPWEGRFCSTWGEAGGRAKGGQR
jgi:hypothetical protein